MTQSLSDQTNCWVSIKSRFKRTKLDRPIHPRAGPMPPWQHVQTHQHTWGQLAYASRGVLTVATSQGRFVVPPNQAVWLPPHLPHETFCRYGGQFSSVYIDTSYVARLGLSAKVLHIDDLLKAMVSMICSWPEDYNLDARTMRFIDVFIDCLECAPTSQFFIPTAQDNRLTPILSELHAHPGCHKTLEQWGLEVGASSRTLNRLFNKSFSMNFSQWKQKLRALRAVEMLESGHSQQYIAQQLGFESSSAFNTAFKKTLATTPGQYLKNR